MSREHYDAYLVDLDGTLYVGRWVKLAMAVELSLFGWAALATLRRFRHEHELMRRELAVASALSTGPSPFAAQVLRTADALGVAPEEVDAVVQAWMFERPRKWIRRFARQPLLAELGQFRAQGGRTALVSDYPARKKVAALGSESLFDVIVANGEEHGPSRLKPDPEGYLRAASLLRVLPSRCLVIGDREDADGAAASAAGMSFRLI